MVETRVVVSQSPLQPANTARFGWWATGKPAQEEEECLVPYRWELLINPERATIPINGLIRLEAEMSRTAHNIE